MCGIAGYTAAPGRPPSKAVLDAIGDAMRHRGPDDDGHYIDTDIGLVHRRLSIIDLAGGKNPIFNEDRSVCVVLNGEIFNYRVLKRDLIARGHVFTTECDTEVLVHLYEERGVDLVEALNGMFAFALYDRRQKRLLLARDRLGQKPLYYSLHRGCFAFASEIQCFHAVPGLPMEIDETSVRRFLRYQYVPRPNTIYRHIRQLDPAHTLIFEHDEIRVENYWQLPPNPEPASMDSGSIDVRFRELLEDSVRCRMMADVPLGAFLSGGLDSAAIVATMADLSDMPVNTFTVGFQSASHDESDDADHVARQLGTIHRCARIDRIDPERIPTILAAFGEPFADASAIPTDYLCQAAREHVTVALSGDAADELLGGYNRYRVGLALARLGGESAAPIWAMLARGARWLPDSHRYYGSSVGKQLKHTERWLSSLVSSGGSVSPRSMKDEELVQLLGHDPEEATSDPVRARDAKQYGYRLPERMLRADCDSYLPDDIFVKIDRVSMRHGLEVRSPFVDYRLVEFVATLPIASKLDATGSKRPLRRLVQHRLPEVVGKRKHGFEPPVAEWLAGPLRDPALDLLHTCGNGVLDRSTVESWWTAHATGRVDHAKRLWPIYVLLVWLNEETKRRFAPSAQNG